MPDTYSKADCKEKHGQINVLLAESRSNREDDLKSAKSDLQKIYDLIRENEVNTEHRLAALKDELKKVIDEINLTKLKDLKEELKKDIDAVKVTNKDNEKEKRSRQWATAMLAMTALISLLVNAILLYLKARGQ